MQCLTVLTVVAAQAKLEAERAAQAEILRVAEQERAAAAAAQRKAEAVRPKRRVLFLMSGFKSTRCPQDAKRAQAREARKARQERQRALKAEEDAAAQAKAQSDAAAAVRRLLAILAYRSHVTV